MYYHPSDAVISVPSVNYNPFGGEIIVSKLLITMPSGGVISVLSVYYHPSDAVISVPGVNYNPFGGEIIVSKLLINNPKVELLVPCFLITNPLFD